MEFLTYDLLLAFVTLTFLEIILGIDNIIFISIAVHNLPQKYKKPARIFGLTLALLIRVFMLFTITWIMSLTKTLFSVGSQDFSANNLIMILGGLFLIVKSSTEIYSDVKNGFHKEKKEDVSCKKAIRIGLIAAILQIAVIDFVFSFDSILTAIAITKNLPIIITAVVISIIVMLLCAESIGGFLEKYPSLKIIALGFIFMIGIILLSDGFDIHISKNYLYFALFFTLALEWLNIVARKRSIAAK